MKVVTAAVKATQKPTCASNGPTLKATDEEQQVIGREPSGLALTGRTSVCHQVSMTGHLRSPTTSNSHCHARGLMGSPTLPRTRSDERSCFVTHLVPCAGCATCHHTNTQAWTCFVMGRTGCVMERRWCTFTGELAMEWRRCLT